MFYVSYYDITLMYSIVMIELVIVYITHIMSYGFHSCDAIGTEELFYQL